MNSRRHEHLLGGTAILLTALMASCASFSSSGNQARPQIRGQFVSRATRQPVDCHVPVVVLAIPAAEARASTWVLPVLRRLDDASSPPLVVVPAGRSVRFVNDDEICHSFFSSSEDNTFELGLLNPEESKTVRFETPGAVQVYCSLHAGKQATILVVPTEHFAIVSSTGEFEIENFEPGAYTLETWSETLPRQRIEITVPPRRTRFVEIPIDAGQVQDSG